MVSTLVMSSKIPPISVRLADEAAARFDALCKEFPGLPQAVVARVLITSALAEPLSDQIELVITGIRKPGGKVERRHADSSSLNRVSK